MPHMSLSLLATALFCQLYLTARHILPRPRARLTRLLLTLLLGLALWPPLFLKFAASTPWGGYVLHLQLSLFGIIAMATFWLVVLDALWVTLTLLQRIDRFSSLARRVLHHWPSPLASRARLVFVLLPTLTLSLLAFQENARPPVVEEVTITLPDLPEAFDGFTIVQLSDLHMGGLRRTAWLSEIVRRVNELQPDLVAITGDLVDDIPETSRADLAPLWWLNPAWGTYFVAGNHEFYYGGKAWESALAEFGITSLHNTSRVLTRRGGCLLLMGVPDVLARRLDPRDGPAIATALKDTPPCATRVLLSHRPEILPDAHRFSLDLVLSGHHHGGQLFPFSLGLRLLKKYFAGHYTLGKTQMWVSRGTGTLGPPMRLFAPAEITRVTLRRGRAT